VQLISSENLAQTSMESSRSLPRHTDEPRLIPPPHSQVQCTVLRQSSKYHNILGVYLARRSFGRCREEGRKQSPVHTACC